MNCRSWRDRRTGCAVAIAAVILTACAVASPARAQAQPAAARPSGIWAIDDVVDLVHAVAAADRFLDRTVVDGRVTRIDQGGDSVSEGQAYALLVSAAIGDEARFRSVWEWTDRHLGRDDGLFAWHWRDGEVRDPHPAADADLLIATALSFGAERFDDVTLASRSRAIATAVIAHETVFAGGRRVLVAGPWAVADGTANPSYWATVAMSRLETDAGSRSTAAAWAEIADSSRSMLDDVTAAWPHLPPDWAAVDAGGDAEPAPSPSGTSARYGWEAVRVPVQLAADCHPGGRAVAARAWPFLRSSGDDVGAVLGLDGTVLDGLRHPAALVGAAGAATAAGDVDAARELLAAAELLDASTPTYYGAAWIALGRLWLTTDLLDGCAG